MSISSWFEPTTSKTTTTSGVPSWIENASKSAVSQAGAISQRPYVGYGGPRIAPFNADQNSAMGQLRTRQAPGEFVPYMPPRLIDNIPGGPNAAGGAGTVKDYMDPFLDEVLGRSTDAMRREASISRQQLDNSFHNGGGEAFGDARHGVEGSKVTEALMRGVGDTTAQLSSAAYADAMARRGDDINRGMQSNNDNVANQGANLNQFLTYIDSLFRSGGNQQEQTQKSLDLGYEDFTRQQDHPTESLNVLLSALGMTPYSKTQTTATPGPSKAGSVLGTIGSVIGSIFGL